jgi:hypothetical protein
MSNLPAPDSRGRAQFASKSGPERTQSEGNPHSQLLGIANLGGHFLHVLHVERFGPQFPLMLPPQTVQEITVIVGPEDAPRLGRKEFRFLFELLARERTGIVREQDPVGLRQRACWKKPIDLECMKSGLLGNARELGPEIQRLVADVDRDYRARSAKVLFINGKTPPGEEMHGDRVARECVQNQNIGVRASSHEELLASTTYGSALAD